MLLLLPLLTTAWALSVGPHPSRLSTTNIIPRAHAAPLLLSAITVLSADEFERASTAHRTILALKRDAPDAFASSWNWVDAYLRVVHAAERPELYRMLRQALMARRALLLFDGLDEGIPFAGGEWSPGFLDGRRRLH